jgi:hypothetical protein
MRLRLYENHRFGRGALGWPMRVIKHHDMKSDSGVRLLCEGRVS